MRNDDAHRAVELERHCRGLIAVAGQEGRDLTPAESEDFNGMERELRRLAPTTNLREKTTGGSTVEYRFDGGGPSSFSEWRSNQHGQANQDRAEYRRAFWEWATTRDLRELDPSEYRALSRATVAGGP